MRRELAGIEPTPARPNGAGYARLNQSATAGMHKTLLERKLPDALKLAIAKQIENNLFSKVMGKDHNRHTE